MARLKELEGILGFFGSSLESEEMPADGKGLEEIIGKVCEGLFKEVGKETSENCLVTNNHHGLLPLQFHDHRLHPCHQVLTKTR